MGLMDSIAQNTGNVEKAIIEILDLRGRGLVEKEAIKVVGGQGGQQRRIPSYDSSAGTSFTNLGVLSDSVKALAGMDKNETPDDVKLKSIASNNWKRYQVKFNPNTLRLSGHSGGTVQKSDYDKEGKGNQFGIGDTTITMSVQLLFDACDPQDAFMGDKSNSSLTAVATGAAKAVMTGLNKKKISVQPEVEGFIGAIRNDYTRIITFHWGNINYTGALRSVRSVYTMFNITGDPVRATVDLSITCADDELSDASLSVWQERYKNAFRKGSESFAYSNGTVNSLFGKGKDALGSGIGGMLGFK